VSSGSNEVVEDQAAIWTERLSWTVVARIICSSPSSQRDVLEQRESTGLTKKVDKPLQRESNLEQCDVLESVRVKSISPGGDLLFGMK
jgi:hypothetical protein